jgi:2-polyprenyl-3-methyl-5-hydroxy-6-metoxy-1,4-benzoquinol methylase
MPSLSRCPICKAENIIKKYSMKDYYCGIKGEFYLWECANCGGYFLNPMLDAHELTEYYPDNYYSYNNKASRRGDWKSLILRYNPLNIWNAIWDRINKGNALGRPSFSSRRGILLDIGCGDGAYLKHIRNLNSKIELYGCDPFGRENDIDLLKKKSIVYMNKGLCDCHYPKKYFDYVCLNHVFEHLPNPVDILKEIETILNENGQLIMGIPNTNSLARLLFQKYWAGFDAPRHLIDYNCKNMEQLLNLIDMKIVKIRYVSSAYYFYESFLFFGRDKGYEKIINNKIIKTCLMFFLSPFVFFLNLLQIGDAVEITISKRKKMEQRV